MKSTVVPVGYPAPLFELPAVDGEPRSLSSYRGRKVVLIFYRGHWCGACRNHLAALTEAAPAMEDTGGSVLAISAEPLATVRAAARRDGLRLTLLSDEGLTAIDAYGIRWEGEPEGRAIARPSVFVVDRDGVVRFAHVGEDPLDRPTTRLILLALESLD